MKFYLGKNITDSSLENYEVTLFLPFVISKEYFVILIYELKVI